MPGNRVHGRIAGKDICQALGIDPTHVRALTIHVSVDEAVTVTIERYVTDQELAGIAGVAGQVVVEVTDATSTNRTYLREPES